VNIASYQERIEQELRTWISNLPEEPENLYAPLRYTLEHGGKRMRPILALTGCGIFSDAIEPAIPAALGIELFHNFTLLHDDIMDNAPLRRGRETVFKKWNSNIAILSGDALFAESFKLMSKSPVFALHDILDLFSQTTIEVCEGQQLDMDFEQRQTLHVDEYLNMIRLKTAVLPAASLKIGALCGGASAQDAELLYSFGLHIGMAFQLQDDILDTFGDSEKVGKQRGGDILANKKTVLVLLALENSSATDRDELRQWYSTTTHQPQEKIAAVIEIFNRSNAREEANRFMLAHQQQAFEAIDELTISETKKEILRQFADQLLHREH
jgi:geranylgeranyl diphosphate synthase, type II